MPIETLRDLADLYLSSGLEPTGKSQDKLSKIQEEFSRRKGEIAKVIRDKLGLSLDPIEEQIAAYLSARSNRFLGEVSMMKRTHNKS